jgi:hypothetical protein
MAAKRTPPTFEKKLIRTRTPGSGLAHRRFQFPREDQLKISMILTLSPRELRGG